MKAYFLACLICFKNSAMLFSRKNIFILNWNQCFLGFIKIFSISSYLLSFALIWKGFGLKQFFSVWIKKEKCTKSLLVFNFMLYLVTFVLFCTVHIKLRIKHTTLVHIISNTNGKICLGKKLYCPMNVDKIRWKVIFGILYWPFELPPN